MSLETGDIEELRTKPEVDLGDAKIPSTVVRTAGRLDVEELKGHEADVAAESIGVVLDQLDSSTGEDDARSPLTSGAVPERLEINTTEEPETEFEAGFTNDILNLLLASKNAESPLGAVTDQEHLENGEYKESKAEEPAFEVASANLIASNSLTESNDDVTLSYRDAVLEHLEGGVGEEPRTEEHVTEVASMDLTVPDSWADGNDTVTLSYRDTVLEDGEGEEPKTEKHAIENFSTDNNVSDSLADSCDAVTLSYRNALLKHPEAGECDEPKTEEHATGNACTDLDVADFSTDGNGAVTPSHGVAVLEVGESEKPRAEEHAGVVADSLKNNSGAVSLGLTTSTGCSAMLPTEEATKGEDLVEELVHDSSFEDAVEVCSVPLEAVVEDGVDRVQVNPENAIAKNESELIFESTDESETAAVIEEAADYLSSSTQLPLEVRKNVIQLQCESSASDAPNGVCLVHIVGTAHVSKASCEEVQALIRHVKPEVVFLELCSSRTNVLLPIKREVPSLSSMIESYKKKQMNLFGLMYCWFLAKVGEKLEVVPGTEFRVAYEEAVRCGAVVTLGDRPIQITLQRTWGKMSVWHKVKLLCSMLTASFSLPSADEFQALMDKMGQSDELTLMIQELSKTYPTLSQTLLLERDLYMVASLRTVARRYSSVVAVVGRGHLSGIADHWKEDISVDELLVVPPKKPLSRMWLWGTVALGVGGVVAGVSILRRR